MKKYILTAIFLLCGMTVKPQYTSYSVSSIPRAEETNKLNRRGAYRYNDISFSSGLYLNSSGSGPLQEGVLYSLYYTRHINVDNLAVRGGIDFIDSRSSEVSKIFIPLKLVYTVPFRGLTFRERYDKATDYYIYERDITSALLSLFSLRMDVNAGISPGYILETENADSDHINSLFASSLDLGARIYLGVWRLKVIADMQYHYLLTNNYQSTPRSYVSVGAGLSFSF